MAGPMDPFTPGTSPDLGVDPETFNRIRGEWDAFMSNPQGRGALLSMGLAMMQPPSFGDTSTAQVGRAVGFGGQAAREGELLEMKRTEAESKQDLRSAQAESSITRADAATSRAEAANARAGAAGDRLGMQAERIKAMNERNNLNNRVRLSSMYQNYVATTQKANGNAKLLGQPEQSVLPINDWIKNNPMLKSMGLLPEGPVSGSEDDEEVPAAASTESLPQAKPNDPNRKPGKYMTPQGPMTWTGTGWTK